MDISNVKNDKIDRWSKVSDTRTDTITGQPTRLSGSSISNKNLVDQRKSNSVGSSFRSAVDTMITTKITQNTSKINTLFYGRKNVFDFIQKK